MDVDGAPPGLNAWAARHGVPGSRAYEEFGDSALVLWHGTSRERADKITEHGLFHKKGLWTARHPGIPHSFCRGRSERFGAEGAVVCLVLDQAELIEGRDFEVEGAGNIFRFHGGLPPEVVQYVLVREEIRFVGADRASTPRPWPQAQFKGASGEWKPLRRAPVRFSDTESFSTLPEYVHLCLARLLDELHGVSPLEAISVLYSLVKPWDCLRHTDVIDALRPLSSRTRKVGKWDVFLPIDEVEATT